MASNHTTELITAERPLFDEARLAVASFLARYSGPTRVSYTADLKNWFAWCHQCGLEIFGVRRGHLELWARTLEDAGLARSTISRRLSTVAGFYRFAAIDGIIEHSPAEYIRRPKVDTESATLGLDRMDCPRSSPKAPPRTRWTTRSHVCSACSGEASPRRATSTSRTSPPNVGTAP